MINEIYIQRKNKIWMKQGSASQSELEYLSTLVCNVQSLGFCFSEAILECLKTYTKKELQNFYLEIVPVLKKCIGAHVSYRPMYPDFPEQVMEMEEAELYWNAILHYATLGYLFPDTEKKERLPYWGKKKMRCLELGTEKEFYGIFSNLMRSKTSLSETDKKDLAWFFHNCPNYFEFLPEEIPLKENLAIVMKLYFENNPCLSSRYFFRYFKTATDVLRLAAALSDGDLSLASVTKFRSFKRAERRLLLDLLENCSSISEDMNRYRERWVRLGERLHPNEYRGYENVKKAFDLIRNKKPIFSFGSEVEKALKEYDYEKAVSLLKTRPGEFTRRLDFLLRNAIYLESENFVVQEFRQVACGVDSTVLLQVREHFKNRGSSQSPVRVFFPKGVIAKAQCIPNELDPLPDSLCESVVSVCEEALQTIYQKRDTMGKVYIGEELKNYLVPFSQRSAGKSFRTVVRGSKIELNPDTSVIRTFIWWKNGMGRTDLDLSAVLFDENWKYVEHISFTNLRSKRYEACHSGDIIDAPQGASEFIDVNLDSLAKYKCRYLAFLVLSYTGQNFCDLPECFMGFMEREKINSGEIYEPKTVENKIDITTESQLVLPVLFDIKMKQYIWADLSVNRNMNWYNTVESNQNSIIHACRSMTEIKKPNLYDLIQLNAQARGTVCETKEEAELIFDVHDGITPYDLEIISANYL